MTNYYVWALLNIDMLVVCYTSICCSRDLFTMINIYVINNYPTLLFFCIYFLDNIMVMVLYSKTPKFECFLIGHMTLTLSIVE